MRVLDEGGCLPRLGARACLAFRLECSGVMRSRMRDANVAIREPASSLHPHEQMESLVEVVQVRASELGEQDLFVFEGSDGARARLSFAALARRSAAIGGALQRMLDPGDRVVLLYPPGLGYIEAFFGCLFAGAIAVPAYPPSPSKVDERLQALMEDAAPRVVLVPSSLLAAQSALQATYPALRQVEWVVSDLVTDGLAAAWRPPAVERGNIAFLQYTSGSTGTPRGVQVTHGNLLHNVGLIHRCFGLGHQDHVVIWLPPYHDMGLIGGLLAPMCAGARVSLLSPLSFLQRPFKWLQLVSELGATVTGGPNFGYDLCVRRLSAEQRASLDLRRWRVAFNGAEPIRAATLHRFREAFAPRAFEPLAFAPCYGLAEATLLVTGHRHGEPVQTLEVDGEALRENRVVEKVGGQELVSSGPLATEQEVLVVEPDTAVVQGDGAVGEIWVRGASVCSGYWNRREESAAVFGASLADGRGPYLRTGDLGFVWRGQLFVTGRIKDLLIIDGRNHYPQDLEATIEQAHPAVAPGRCVAFSVDRDDTEVVVVVAALQDARAAHEAEQAVRRALQARHELALAELVWVPTGEIPRTSSGKLRRRECRARFLAGTLQRR